MSPSRGSSIFRSATGPPVRCTLIVAVLAVLGFTPVRAGDLVLKGRVVDGRGFPLISSRVYLETPKRTGVAVDKDGWYSVKVAVPSLEQLARTPLELTLAAYRKGWAIGLQSGGGTRLRMEIAAWPDTDRALSYRLRSNDPEAAVGLAGLAVLEGEVAGTLEVHFTGVPGEQLTPEEKLTIEQKVRVAGARSATADPPPTGRPSGAATAAPKPSSTPPHSAAPSTAPPTSLPVAAPPLLTPISRAAVPTYAPGCTCSVSGTVEVISPRLNEPLDVVVWLESAPRDSQRVEMFMGAPREFHLVARGCGSHRIRFATRRNGKQIYQAMREVVVDCTDRSLRQPRLVLEPAPRRRDW